MRIVLVVVLLLAVPACASHQPALSGRATSYAGLGPVERNGDSRFDGHARQRPLDAADVAAFGAARLAVVDLAAVRSTVRPETAAAVEAALRQHVGAALAARFAGSDAGAPALEVRLVVTRITESSPALNVATSLLLGPFRNGALAVEAEIVDARSGRQVGLFAWADEGGVLRLREAKGNFQRAGHARALSEAFARSLSTYMAPLASEAR